MRAIQINAKESNSPHKFVNNFQTSENLICQFASLFQLPFTYVVAVVWVAAINSYNTNIISLVFIILYDYICFLTNFRRIKLIFE